MRLLTIAVLLASGLWFGYWLVGSRALDAGVTGWLEQMQADGAAVEWSDVAVQGFPNRFDLTISDPAIGDAALLQWRADFFQLLTRSYAPYHLIAVWPDSQSLVTPLATLTLASEKARASVRFRPVPSLPLDEVILVVDRGQLSSTSGWQALFEQVRFATRQRPDLADAHRIGLDVIGLVPDQALRQGLPTLQPLPEVVDRIHADITLQPDAPLDRFAFAGDGLRLLRLDVTQIAFDWGSIGVEASGALARDAAGFGEGTISLRIRDWRGLMALLAASGGFDPLVLGTLGRAMEVLQGLQGQADVLDVPIKFAEGRGSIAGLPILLAPRF